MNDKTKNKWRIFPKINYTNFRKHFPNSDNRCYDEWFSIHKVWSWRVIGIFIKHHCLTLDFRKNWVKDMIKNHE